MKIFSGWRGALGALVVLLALAYPTVQAYRFWTASGRGTFVVERCTGGSAGSNGWCDGVVLPDDGGQPFSDDVYRPHRAPERTDQFAVRYRDDAFGTWVAHDRAAVGWAWTWTALTPLVVVGALLAVFKIVVAGHPRRAALFSLVVFAALLVGPVLIGYGMARPIG